MNAISQHISDLDTTCDGPNKPPLEIRVVSTFEEMAKIIAIRGAVFLSEQKCPYEEEFDGNDFTGMHLIGYVGDEPAACLRIRFFSDFAKPERLAVRADFRNTRIAFKIVRAGIEICRRKGYQKLYGHAQQRLTKFWGVFGFEAINEQNDLTYSDHSYVEMVATLRPHEDAISLESDPMLIIRPEGGWDKPGILEWSAVRPATNPVGATAQ